MRCLFFKTGCARLRWSFKYDWSKRPLLEKYHKGKTSVRLHNIHSSIKDDIENIIIQNNTTVEAVALPYVYKDATVLFSLPSLSSLQEMSKEQLVDIKAKVSSITGIKTFNSHYDHPLKKEEVILVDHTTLIKLVLWQEHCNKFEDQKTYGREQWQPLSEHSKVRAVSLQRDSSFYTSHYRDGVTDTEQNISQIN